MLAFIIFGTTGITSTRDRGIFFCPSCNNDQNYALKRVRRFFTLYFIPLIPLDTIGEFIECSLCRQSFDLTILSYDPGAEQQEFYQTIKRVMILMMIADGSLDDVEIVEAQRYYNQLSGQELSREEIAQEVQFAQAASATLSDYTASIAPSLGQAGKELVVKAAFISASAGGSLHDAQKLELQQLPRSLGISQDDFRRIVDEVSQGE